MNHSPSPLVLLLVAAAPVGLVVLLPLLLLLWWAALPAAAAATAGMVLFVRSRAATIVLDRVRAAGAVPLDAATPAPARLDNLLASIAAATGVPKPDCLVVPDEAVDALVTGQPPASVTFVATSGLVDSLDRLQLESVVAHQLAGVRAGATQGREVALAVRTLPWGRVGPLGTWTDALLATGPAEQLVADATAVGVTRFPPGLLGALEVAAARPAVSADPVLGPLWWLSAERDHLDLRIDHLRELT